MWPVGYVIGSPFSPLQLEMEIPEGNWRDAFEDLIALETCGQMISNESREKEAEVHVHLLRQDCHDAVSQVNDMLERDSKDMSILQRMRKLAARHNMFGMVSQFDKDVLQNRMRSQEFIDSGQAIISALKRLEQADKLEQSSRALQRGHWIASLFSSGALPGWQSKLHDSAIGHYWSFVKNDGEGLSISEFELSSYFGEGRPIGIESPAWSTESGGYPEIERIDGVKADDGSSMFAEIKAPPLPHSICIQAIGTDRTKIPNGFFSTRVKIWNRFTDGREEEKHIVDDTRSVLEEVKKAMVAMGNRRHRVKLAWRDKQIKEADANLKEHENFAKMIEMED